jgi:DNA-binding transcriptional regulator YdaS (Cro superfamily)
MTPTEQTPLQRAFDQVGGIKALSVALNISPSVPSMWKARGTPVPAEYCPAIQRITGGRVTCKDLRPDVDWDGAAVVAKQPAGEG